MEKTPKEIKDKFEHLKTIWQSETTTLAFIKPIVSHPAYQEIIGMDRPVLPLLLDEMSTRPNLWFIALSQISGIDVTSPDDSFKEATDKWINWGKENNLILQED